MFGPLLGALVVRGLGEATKLVAGDAPGLDLVIYGTVLIVVVAFAPRGIAGLPSDGCCGRLAKRNRSGAVAEPLLRVEHISCRFGGVLAVDGVSFDVMPGRITALIGPNGAGKTTLFSVISGFLKPDAGRVVYDGADITGEPPHRLARRGIARTFQIVQPFAGLSVRDNILLVRICATRSHAEALAAAEKVAREIGLGDMLDRPAHTLTVAGRKRLELARALATEPTLLLLDEVLAGLNPSEIRDIVPVIRALSARGIAIVMIEHVMQAVMSLAEHVFVLAEGRIIAEGSPAQVADNPAVVEAYLGHGAAADRQVGPCLSRMLAAPGLHAGYGDTKYCAASILALHNGEIVAVLGSNGVGKSTLNRTISGVIRPWRGTIRFNGAAIERERPAHIVAQGLIHVPEGRRIFANMTVRENLDLGAYRRGRARRDDNRTACSRSSRAWPSGSGSAPARCRAASSRCWPSAAASWRSRSF